MFHVGFFLKACAIFDYDAQYSFHVSGFVSCFLVPCEMSSTMPNDKRDHGLTSFFRVADLSMQHIAQILVHLHALTISGCHLVTDEHLEKIVQRNSGLAVLGLSRCPGLTTNVFTRIPVLCAGLKTVDLSHNANVTDDVLGKLAKYCRRLESLYLQYCVFITDGGAQALAVEVNHDTLTSLDFSGCVLLSDHSVVALGQLCRKLRRLNLKAVNRVTEEGASRITHDCWDLEYLCFEDMYNLVDSAFVFDFSADGRRAVEANMLGRLTDINLHDCNKLTDTAVDHIMRRATQLSSLNLAGCCHLTDAACKFIVEDPEASVRRGMSLTSLNLGYCLNITDEGVAHLVGSLTRLRYVNFSGCVQLTDGGILKLVSTCTKLQEIIIARCKQLTDKSLCYMADFLWVEDLDVSHCSKISDDGVEVIALEFAGLHRIRLTRCSRLTERTLEVLSMYCPHLKTVEMYHVPNISNAAVDRLSKMNPGLTVLADART